MIRLQARWNQLLNRMERSLARPRLLSRPVDVDVVLTKACNLSCLFCKDYQTDGDKKIALEDFERMAAQLLPTACRLNICSGGEPYLHRGLVDILRIARRYGVETWLLSNGMVMDEKRVRTIIRERLVTHHGFSVDGNRPDTVARIRRHADLNTILDNMRMVLRMREEEGRDWPLLTVRYALMRSNIEELPEAVRRWGEMGVDFLECDYLSLANNIDRKESLFFHQRLMKRIMERARREAEAFPRLHLRLPQSVKKERLRLAKPSACTKPWSFVMIDSDGQVLPCYRAFERLRLPTLYGPDGFDFETVWNGSSYQLLRRTVNDDAVKKFYPYCSQCEARFGWGRLEAHLGDETWMSATAPSAGEETLDHRRPGHKGDTFHEMGT